MDTNKRRQSKSLATGGPEVNYTVDNKRIQAYNKCASCTLLDESAKRKATGPAVKNMELLIWMAQIVEENYHCDKCPAREECSKWPGYAKCVEVLVSEVLQEGDSDG
jgi:hypothetical protein